MAKLCVEKQDINYDSFLSDDCLADFLRILKRYPAANAQDNYEMFTEYYNGNEEMRDLIINRNIRLVVSDVFKSKEVLTPSEKLDYIQAGIVGLIEAFNTYDINRGTTFSTHAENWIQMRIKKYRYNNKRVIRRPVNFELALGRYKRLVRECEKTGKPLPTNEEICKELKISEDTLNRIQEDFYLDPLSLDTPVDSDDDDMTLANVVGTDSKDIEDIFDKIVLEEILKTVRIKLNDYEYYVFYYRIFAQKPKTLEQLSQIFGLTREGVRVTEEKVKRLLKNIITKDGSVKREHLDNVKMNYDFTKIKMTPCPFENYFLFFYLKDTFIESDQIILKELLLGKLDIDAEELSNEIMSSKEYVLSRIDYMNKLLKETKNSVKFKLFFEHMKEKYSTKIYRIDPDTDLSDDLNIKNIIIDYFKDKDISECMDLVKSYSFNFSKELESLIKRFYGYGDKKKVTFNKEKIERDVNYSIYGFVLHDLSLLKLYPVFLNNQDLFTEKQKNYLNQFIFKKTKKDLGLQSYYINSIVDKLILLSYKVEDYKSDNFELKKYMSIRDECVNELDERSIKLLDLYYGKKMNIREMSIYFNEDVLLTEKDFRRAKSNAINIYLGTRQYTFDKSIYSAVLKDAGFELGEPHLTVSKMFFLDNMSYEEIAESYIKEELTPRRVSDLIKYSVSVMDYYRFGITSTQKNFSSDFLTSILNGAKMDEEVKNILRVFINNRDTVKTAEVCNYDLDKVRNFVRRLYNLANRKAVENVVITKEDVEKSINEHISTNVLNEREKLILSLYYGIKNAYNPSGKKHYPIDIGPIIGVSVNVGSLVRKACEHVAAHKLGLLKTAIDFVDRSELEKALRDKRLPLSDEDKKIIINAYGLYDTEYYTITDIAKMTGLRDPIARKRLYKGIVTIKKYLNKEIDGEVIFKTDIKPYLKYFILDDRDILTMLYRDKKMQTEVEEKYGFSKHQLNLLLQKIRMHLSDLRLGEKTGIDFDYFWSNALEDDIPYYGNQKLAQELCFLYYEKRLSQSEIISLYHPELSDTAVSEIIKGFTAAVLKHQHGIRKVNDFTFEDVLDYYERNNENFGVVSAKVYRNYFAKIKREGPVASIRPGKFITFDLIKERCPDYFKLDKATLEQVRDILGSYGHTIPRETVSTLESLFGVTHANLLDEDEWDKIIKVLGNVMLKENTPKNVEQITKKLV